MFYFRHKFYISFVKFIHMYFILLDAIVDGIVFLISFSDCSLQIYRSTINFGRLICVLQTC